ncbi:hypothetical protein NUSPORA_01325 [Nucleospora cyclopteri]
MKKLFKDITNSQHNNVKITIHKKSHRKTLFRWLYDVTIDFKYSQYTFITALLIVESYTRKYNYTLEEYQLIGVSSLYISAKLEETRTKSVIAYEYVTNYSCKKEQILERETVILERLDYGILYTLPQSFVKLDYLNKNYKEYPLEEKREIHCCVLAGMLERGKMMKNMCMVCIEALKETEKILKKKRTSEDVFYYIKKNPVISEELKEELQRNLQKGKKCI